MKHFTEIYELVADETTNKRYIKGGEKKCRYCSRNQQKVTFNNAPHVIPELFGKNPFTWNNECDECNKKFQKWESHAANFVQPYFPLIGTKTKKKIPQFRSRKENGQQSTIIENNGISRHINLGSNLEDFKYTSDNTAEIKIRSQSFIPFNIYRLLLKIGISLIPETDSEYISRCYKCLDENKPNQGSLQRYIILRHRLIYRRFSTPNVYLYKARNVLVNKKLVPEYVMIIGFSTFFFQVFMPLSNANIHEMKDAENWHLEYFPAIVYDQWHKLSQIHVETCDLSISKKVSYDEIIPLSFSRLERDILS